MPRNNCSLYSRLRFVGARAAGQRGVEESYHLLQISLGFTLIYSHWFSLSRV